MISATRRASSLSTLLEGGPGGEREDRHRQPSSRARAAGRAPEACARPPRDPRRVPSSDSTSTGGRYSSTRAPVPGCGCLRREWSGPSVPRRPSGWRSPTTQLSRARSPRRPGPQPTPSENAASWCESIGRAAQEVKTRDGCSCMTRVKTIRSRSFSIEGRLRGVRHVARHQRFPLDESVLLVVRRGPITAISTRVAPRWSIPSFLAAA